MFRKETKDSCLYGFLILSLQDATPSTKISPEQNAYKALCEQLPSHTRGIHRGDIYALPYPYQWSNSQCCKLLPLCRAIMIILDRLLADEDGGTEDDGTDNPDHLPHP